MKILYRLAVPMAVLATICLVEGLPPGTGVTLAILCILDSKIERVRRREETAQKEEIESG